VSRFAAPVAALAFAAALAVVGGTAHAQGFDMAKGGDTQIQVYADDGIEWQSQANRVVAHGHAKAVRGDVTIIADTLIAFYRQGAGGNEIWRIDADGHVVISNPNDTATGTSGTYDLDKAIFVLHGQPAKLVTPSETFTADDTLEYWELQHMAVLRGNGVAVQKDKNLKGDVLTAHFKDKDGPGGKKPPAKPAAKGGNDSGGGLELQRADAYGHVVMTTAQEVITGDRGDYNMETDIATISGSVKILRDGNELNGGYAHVDLNSGISKLFGGAPGGEGGKRVRGVFSPEKKDKAESGAKERPVFQGKAPSSRVETSDHGGQ
jgi:lipopolysaccharide export system protein LptA